MNGLRQFFAPPAIVRPVEQGREALVSPKTERKVSRLLEAFAMWARELRAGFHDPL